MLRQFSVWTVGDGCDIDAWIDVWIEEGLCLDQHLTIPSHLLSLKVGDLVDGNGNWNWRLFESWMPDEYQQKNAAICPPNHDNGRDFRAGVGAICPPNHDNERDFRAGVGGNTSGYSVASMYSNMCGFHHKDESVVWCKVWKLKTPERVRAFTWMAMHNRLITNSIK
ncbi:putative ribonuclease H protein, partial [Trifolium medium]|nr:putative ribonuclease H protein [Trifolium medium]